ncbi:MAG TPA: hypothetical protein VGN72_06840 [Tepidisphaeraceae bacterium]|jgi:hypothetical protein|nr:hypothetical protein [Tepidisphaeraceae bacterium]
MKSLFFQFLGIPADGATRIADGSVAFRGAGQLGWFFIAMLLLIALAAWSYWKTARDVPPLKRYTMAALRATLLTLLLVLLLRPVFRYTVEGSVRRSLLVMLDTSASMKIADTRTEDADIKRVAIARNLIDPAKGLDQSIGDTGGLNAVNRIDVVKAGLKNERLKLLQTLSEDYDLRPMSFGQGVEDLGAANTQAAQSNDPQADRYAWVNRLDAPAPATALGDGVRDTLLRSRGQPLAGVWLVTDGQSNTGSQPLAAAEIARQEGVPLYVWGVGISSPKDIVVASMFAQEVAFLKDQVPVVVRVKGAGLEGRTAKLKLSLGGQPVDVRDVTFSGDEQVISMEFTPDKPGDFDLVATIDAQGDEAVKDNNTVAQRVKVIDRKIKVLLIETTPRWEYKYLQVVLMRDRRVDAKFLLLEADSAMAAGADSPYLARFPRDKKELFTYDLIILGDVDPRQFAQQQLEAINEFVDKFGGGLLVVAGRRFNPTAFKDTPIGKMLPVQLEANRGIGAIGRSAGSADDATRPIKVELTPAGHSSLFMRLTDRQQDNADAWTQLPPIYWAAPVAGAKPGAEVLAVDAGQTTGRMGEKMPIFALQQYGLGQVFYSGTDNTWRWRKNAGESRHIAFWGQIIQRLAMAHLLGESKRTQLTLDRANYFAGDRVTVYARLYDTTFQPIEAPEVKGTYSSADGRTTGTVSLRPLPDQKGMYRGEFVAPPQGQYEFWVDRDERTRLAMNVGESRIEFSEIAMNEPLLRQLATASGGAFFREEDLHTLPSTISQQSESVKSRQEVDIWSSPAYFLLLLGVVSAEWIMRKIFQLK